MKTKLTCVKLDDSVAPVYGIVRKWRMFAVECC